MYALFILVDLIKNGFPEKQISVISRNVHLAGDLMFDGEELLKLYRMVKDRFGVTIFPETRFETLGALADYIEDRW
ncbi:MAG: hypothetical protein GXY05_14895 [Clostridiales bacterium]|nr:hypothetical protein [Clostridiales bacterium]